MNFEQAEQRGRNRFTDLCKTKEEIKNLRYTTYAYDHLDALFEFGEYTFGVEIKYRESEYGIWNINYDKLVNAEKEFGKRISPEKYYIVFITKDKFYLYDYKTIKSCVEELGLIERPMPMTTFGKNKQLANYKLIQLPADRAVVVNKV